MASILGCFPHTSQGEAKGFVLFMSCGLVGGVVAVDAISFMNGGRGAWWWCRLGHWSRGTHGMDRMGSRHGQLVVSACAKCFE